MVDFIRLPPDARLRPVAKALSETIDWSQQFLHLPDAWLLSEGEGIHAAAFDTGYAPHVDLEEGMVDQLDFTGTSPLDKVGHGTWCLGMLGARANGFGVRGVMPKCRLSSYKVLNDFGVGEEQWMIDAFDHAITSDVDLVSISAGGPSMSEALHERIRRFVASRKGRFVFCAAGNSGNKQRVDFPARWDECICVGAIDSDGRPTRFSNGGPRVDCYAPGTAMISTTPDGYGEMTGTSMACPQAAGVGGLALAKHRKTNSTTDLDSPAAMRAHIKKTSRKSGNVGIIDPVAILTGLEEALPPPVRTPVYENRAFRIFAPPPGSDKWDLAFTSDQAREQILAALKGL